jgi:hypothetical protein
LPNIFLTGACTVARLVRPGTSTHVVLTIGNVRTGADCRGEVASLTRCCTCAVAANAIDAETAEAFDIGATNFGDFFLACSRAVARLVYPGARGNTIRVILPCGDVRANAYCTGDIARLARTAARDVAANAVKALAADAIGVYGACIAIFRLADAGRIARFHSGARSRCNGVFAGRDIRAYPDAAHGIAHAASGCTRAGAAHAIGAEVTHAIGCGCATLRVVLFTCTCTVTRIRSGTTWQVFGGFGHIDARSNATRHIARFTRGATRRIATDAIDTEAAQTIATCSAYCAVGLFARACSIAYGSTRLVASDVDHLKGIRRNAHCADVLRALIPVDGFVGTIRILDGCTHPIAFDNFAILTCLARRQIRSDGCVAISANLVDARTRLAEIVRPDALSGVIASDAIAYGIAYLIRAADKIFRFQRIRGHTICANILRARIVVDRKVRIEVFTRGATSAIANDALTIARYLSRRGCRRCARCRERLSAHVVHACACLAIIVGGQKHAIAWHVALYASTLAIANFWFAHDARRAQRNTRI